MTTLGDVGGTIFFTIIVIILVVALIYFMITYIRKRKEARMEHVGLYFDEHFRDIIKEWDLTSRSKVKDWSKDMGKRLDGVKRDIDKLTTFRTSFDSRLDKLESDVEKLEVL
jgi:hypothetical protein